MKHFQFIFIMLTGITFLIFGAYNSGLSAGGSKENQQPPNIIFIFADDLGWADLPAYGHQPHEAHGGWTMRGNVKTPKIDKLAKEGTMYTQFYVPSAVCSPSRAGLITGKFPAEVKIHDYMASAEFNEERGMPNHLDTGHVNIMQMLKNQGYATGHFGKWNLGEFNEDFQPSDYGIDQYLECLDGPGGRPYSSRQIANASREFIDQHANSNEPFYINVWLWDPHSPLKPTEEQLEPYEHLSPGWKDQTGALQVWYAVLTAMDKQIGRIIDYLEEKGIRENTLIVFSSDNGAESGLMRFTHHYGGASSTNTGPFRGIKRSLYEGGIRMPFIVSWPGRIPEGRVDQSSVIGGVDFLPTIAGIVGAEVPEGWEGDGMDISSSLLQGTTVQRNKPLMWENRFPVYGHVLHKSPMLAIREGDWKLLLNPDRSRVELYNIPEDPSEVNNRASQKPEIVDSLAQKVVSWQKTLPEGKVHPDAGAQNYPWPGEF